MHYGWSPNNYWVWPLWYTFDESSIEAEPIKLDLTSEANVSVTVHKDYSYNILIIGY